jgi:hypothetical protein
MDVRKPRDRWNGPGHGKPTEEACVIEATPAPEEWRAARDFVGSYEVSTLGRVRSVDRVILVRHRSGTMTARRRRGQIIKPALNPDGYLYVRLGRSRNCRVNVLVARAFLESQPPGTEVLHGPGGKTDNRVSNLRYGTHAENQGPDRLRDGTDVNGDKCPAAKLTWAQVDEIRQRLPVGLRTGPRPKHLRHLPTQRDLADEYRVSATVISKIVAGKTWRPECRPTAP